MDQGPEVIDVPVEVVEVPSKKPLYITANGYFKTRVQSTGEKFYKSFVKIGMPISEIRLLRTTHKTASRAVSYGKKVIERYYRLFQAGV